MMPLKYTKSRPPLRLNGDFGEVREIVLRYKTVEAVIFEKNVILISTL